MELQKTIMGEQLYNCIRKGRKSMYRFIERNILNITINDLLYKSNNNYELLLIIVDCGFKKY